LLPVFRATPSSFHKPRVSSKYHKGREPGAEEEIEAGIGKVTVAFDPLAI